LPNPDRSLIAARAYAKPALLCEILDTALGALGCAASDAFAAAARSLLCWGVFTKRITRVL
jgi:hypothetical protein